ncbi:MAG: hypothetical protein ACE15B_08650 [Bryobacteraceae bacterium]
MVNLALILLAAAAPARPAEVEALVDRARGLAPEFAADALIRIADKVNGREWKRELLEDAFRRAAGAQQPLKKAAVAPLRGTPNGLMDRAFAQGLDALSLQCRAVRALIPLDPAKARELFFEIPAPKLQRLGCEDPLVYDPSSYYVLLGEIAGRAFGPNEAADEPFKLLQSRLGALESPLQLAPAARLLASARLNAAEFQALAAGFAAALKNMAGDDRSFSFAISRRGGLSRAMLDLVRTAGNSEAGAQPLVEAYRAFLVRHLKAERCADSSEPVSSGASFGLAAAGTPLAEAEQVADAVRFFNDSLRVPDVRPIAGDEVLAAKVAGAAGGLRVCESAECKDFVRRYNALLFGAGGMPLGPEQKAAAEWHARLKEYLGSLAEWREDSSGGASLLFVQKCQLYSDLVNVVPNGADREMVLRAYAGFLEQNSYQRESRIEWFLPANTLIARVFMDPIGLRTVMEELRNSSDPVISFYCALEAFAPRPPGESLSLL